MAQAVRRCPRAQIIRGRMDVYRAVSHQVRAIFERFTPEIEPLSIDEAFLDVTGSTRLFGPGEAIARRIKTAIRDELHLSASIGVAPNKMLAKLASDLDKPDGLTIVPPDDIAGFLGPLSVERLWGAGPRTLQKLTGLGIHTLGQARALGKATWRREFGDAGERFYALVRGLDERPVQTDRDAKSISHEQTFRRDITDIERLRIILLEQTEQVAQRLRAAKRSARTVTLKIRSDAFETLNRSHTLRQPTNRTDQIWQAAAKLFDTWRREHGFPVRLIGMGVSGLVDPSASQLDLFADQGDERQRRLDAVADQIRTRFGKHALSRDPATQRPQTPYETMD
jgi:DNA polymerase-4